MLRKPAGKEDDETAKKVMAGIAGVVGAIGLATGLGLLIDKAIEKHSNRSKPAQPSAAHPASADDPPPPYQSSAPSSSGTAVPLHDDADSGDEDEDEDDDDDSDSGTPEPSNGKKQTQKAKNKRKKQPPYNRATSARSQPSAESVKSKSKFRSSVDARLIDCSHFLSQRCRYGDACKFRHQPAITSTTPDCRKWPNCTNDKCRFQHSKPASAAVTPSPAVQPSTPVGSRSDPSSTLAPPSSPYLPSLSPVERSVSYLWDIENCPIPHSSSAFSVIQRTRALIGEADSLRERSFTCYCNPTSLSTHHRIALSHANVQLVDVPPDRKAGAADRRLQLDLDRLMASGGSGSGQVVVLISGDIDFVSKLNDLRYRLGYTVVLVHGRQVNAHLKQTAHRTYEWSALVAGAVKEEAQEGKRGGEGQMVSRVVKEKMEAEEKKEEQWKCPKCPITAKSAGALTQHQQAKDHWWQCPASSCTRQFDTAQAMKVHQKDKNH